MSKFKPATSMSDEVLEFCTCLYSDITHRQLQKLTALFFRKATEYPEVINSLTSMMVHDLEHKPTSEEDGRGFKDVILQTVELNHDMGLMTLYLIVTVSRIAATGDLWHWSAQDASLALYNLCEGRTEALLNRVQQALEWA
jgi:hypothetical protein